MKNLVVFTAFKQAPDNIEYRQWCFESWKRWAKKYDVELIVLEDPLVDVKYMKPTWQRWYIFDILENMDLEFDQIASVDIDTLIHPNAPNFFELTKDKPGIGVVKDDIMIEWIYNSIAGYNHLFPDVSLNWTDYFNCGFVVLKNNEESKKLCMDITSFYNDNHTELKELQHSKLRKGSDQTPVNYMVVKNNVNKIYLDGRWNCTHLHIRGALSQQMTEFNNLAYIYHFNGFEKSLRDKLMENSWKSLSNIL